MGEHLVVAGAVLGLVAVVAALTAGGLLVLAYLHQARLEHHAWSTTPGCLRRSRRRRTHRQQAARWSTHWTRAPRHCGGVP